jgi:amino acid transporter
MATVEAISTESATPTLRRDSVGLIAAVVMSAAIMGPAVSTFFNPQFSTPFSGNGTAFVYLLCLIVILITASGLMEMAAVAPSAGSFYTYVTRSLGARAGFVTGGLMFIAYMLLAPIEIGLIGAYLQSTFQQEFNVNIPWVFIGVVPWALMAFLAFEGIRVSLRTAMVLFTAEVLVVVGLALIIVLKGGASGVTVDPLLPSAAPQGFNGIVVGFIFAALSFVGFEGAATLGEEVRHPRRNVPRAILYSTLLVGGIYVFCIWAESIGLGAAKMNALTGADTPWNQLAATYAPWMKWLVILASVSSMFAVMVNSNNGIVRLLHTMGRERMLPRRFGTLDPRRRTPVFAIMFEAIFTIGVAVLVGIVSGGLTTPIGGSNVYGYLGFALTLAILPVYALTNIATMKYFVGKPNFNPLRHLVLPGLGAALMIALLVGQIIENPTAPFNWMPYALIAWVVIVGAVALWLGRNRPLALQRAGAILGTGDVVEEIHPQGAAS